MHRNPPGWKPRLRRILPFLSAALVLGSLLFASGPVIGDEASGLGFGSVVRPGDGDTSNILSALEPPDRPSVCHLDAGEEGYQAGEPVYLAPGAPDCSIDPGHVASGWVRLSASGQHPPGSRVLASHDDRGEAVGRVFDLDHFDVDLLWYHDANDNDAFDQGDTSYLSPDAVIGEGDIRLNVEDEGTDRVVRAGDPEVNQGLRAWQIPRVHDAFHYLETDGRGGFGREDTPYLVGVNEAPTHPVVPRVNEIRLDTYDAQTPPGRVKTGDKDMTATLGDRHRAGEPHVLSLCALSRDGSQNYRVGDPVYLAFGSVSCRNHGRTQEHDLRLLGEDAGTRVRVGDEDHRLGPLIQLDGAGPSGTTFLRYLDMGPFGFFNDDDTLYLVSDASRTNVRAGDIRLTAYQDQAAGSTVRAGDPDQNIQTEAFAPDVMDHIRLFAYHDRNGNGVSDWDDTVYLRSEPDQSWLVHNQVQLGPLANTPGFGSLTRIGEPGVLSVLRSLRNDDPATYICALDETGEDRYVTGAGVILRREGTCADPSSFSDLRLTTSDHGPAGSLLRSQHGDWGRDLVPLGEALCLDRTKGPGRIHDAQVALYLTRCSDAVANGDIRLTPLGGLPAGRAVREGDVDHNQPLADGAATTSERTWDLSQVIHYLDIENRGRLTSSSVAYLALDRKAGEVPVDPLVVRVNDVRLMPAYRTIAASEPPGEVRELRAEPGDGRVTLSWEPPEGHVPVRGYTVQWGPGADDITGTMMVDETQVVIEGLENGRELIFRVVARNEAGDGPLLEIRVVPNAPGVPEPPSAPRAVQVRTGSSDAIEVSWQEPETGRPILDYRVEATLATGDDALGDWTTSETSLSIHDLDKLQTTTFRVYARNAAGEGPPSEAVFFEPAGPTEDAPAPMILLVAVVVTTILATRKRR